MDFQPISETNLSGLIQRGKVRDTYDLGDDRLLMIATDRISAFDVVLPTPIRDKGRILSQMSRFWFELLDNVVSHHMIAMADDTVAMNNIPSTGALKTLPPEYAQRSMVVKKAERIDIECVVRAYITGSAWAEYTQSGNVNGARMPSGLKEADPFPELLFTPTTKAEKGHDEPLTASEVKDMVGNDMARRLEEASKTVFQRAHDHAHQKGMIIADSKFEFGLVNGELTLIDEVLTPDSSRFWDIDQYAPGSSPPAFDKQFVRDWLTKSGWDREPPAPKLPQNVVEQTRNRFLTALERLTGETLVGQKV